MPADARRHHHIPQFYLRGFAGGSGKRCKVTVGNLKAGRFFETNPKNVGAIRDFNRVHIEGLKPDVLEGILSNFEGEVASAIRNVTTSSRFEGEDRVAILNLAALLAVRSPQMRENWRQFQERIAKQVMSLTLATKDRWESTKRQMERDGKTLPHDIAYEELKRFHESGAYDVVVPTEMHVRLEFEGMDAVLPYLVRRKWSLFTTTEQTGLFVTSDRPVVLTWKNPDKLPPLMRRSPGFGMADTEVVFPLSKFMAIAGDFEGREGTFESSPRLVATINSRMLTRAHEQIYAAKQHFPYLGPRGEEHHDRHVFEAFGAQQVVPADGARAARSRRR